MALMPREFQMNTDESLTIKFISHQLNKLANKLGEKPVEKRNNQNLRKFFNQSY